MEKSQELTNQIQKTINNPIINKIKSGTQDIQATIANTNKTQLDKNQISSEEDIIENKLIQKRTPII